MTRKEYTGKIKYLGSGSISQDFKLANVVLEEENNRLYLRAYLKCNPRQVFRSNDITRSSVKQKGSRVVVSWSTSKSNFWELHFIGVPERCSKDLYVDVDTALKKTAVKTPTENKAAVGLSRNLTSFSSNASNQNGKHSKENQEFLKTENRNSVFPMSIAVSPAQSSSGGLSSSPLFTSVKTNTRIIHIAGDDVPLDDALLDDDDGKENQHRGLSSPEAEQKYKNAERKPMQPQGIRFYGSSASNGYCFPGPRPKAIERIRQEKKSGQFSDIIKTYTWNHRQDVSPAVVKQQTPQLLGFANIGNTCFMNAILQSLFSLDTLLVDLQSLYKQHGKTIARNSLAGALFRLMLARQRPQFTTTEKLEHLLRNVKDAISSTAKRFSGSQQHDAHEFLSQVLDQLKEEVMKITSPKEEEKEAETSLTSSVSSLSSASEDTAYTLPEARSVSPQDRSSPQGDKNAWRVSVSPADDQVAHVGGRSSSSEKKRSALTSSSQLPTSAVLLNPTLANFEFEVIHSFQCLNCGERIEKAEQFNDLSVDMPTNTPRGMKLSLQDALDMFFQKGEITDYSCEKCGKKSTAELTHRFAKLPRVLILHLKRYSYDGHSRKMLEDLQLPRYITLQDHCDLSPVPHLQHRLTISSPMKSPVTPGSMRYSAKRTSDGSNRRRRFNSTGSENWENDTPKRSPKKVRRSLLSEVDADTSAGSDKKDDTSYEDDVEKAIAESKKEVAPLEEDFDPYEDDLVKVLELSRREYLASNNFLDHHYSNSNSNSQDTNNNNNNNQLPLDDEEGDVSRLTEEQQLALAINRSMAESSFQNGFSSHNLPPCSWKNGDDAVGGSSSTFKKPSGFDNTHTPLGSRRASGTPSAKFQPRDWGLDYDTEIPKAVKSFTRTGDFVADAAVMRTSPDGNGDCDRKVSFSLPESADNTSSSNRQRRLRTPPLLGLLSDAESNHKDGGDQDDQSFTSCRRPLPKSDQLQSSNSKNRTDKGHTGVDMDIDPWISLSGRNNHESSTRRASGSPTSPICLSPVAEKPLTTPGFNSELTPLVRKMKTNNCGRDDSCYDSPTAVNGVTSTETWSPEEEKMIADAMDHDMNDGSDMQLDSSPGASLSLGVKNTFGFESLSTPEKKDGNKRAEKENQSPPSYSTAQHVEAPIDKETERKILKHKLRLTEIEKGILPHSYRLVSIVNHLGETSGFGHYVSDALDIKKQTWFSYDDKDVRKTTEAFVRTKRTSTGYIFFYLSKDIFEEIDSMRPNGSGKELAERLSTLP